MRRSTPTGGPAGCPTTFGSFSNEGTGHRRGRIHRIASLGRAARCGRQRHRHRLFHRLLSPASERSQPRRRSGPARIHVRRGRAPGHRPQGAARRRDPRLPSGRRRPGCGKAGDAISTSIQGTTSRRLSACWKRWWACRSKNTYTPRARRSTATTCRCPCARTHICSRCRPTACRSWRRASGPALLRQSRRAGGIAAVFHGVRPTSAAGHGISALPDRRAGMASPSPCTATVSRHATSRSSPTSSPRTWPPRTGAVRAACTILVVAPGSR